MEHGKDTGGWRVKGWECGPCTGGVWSSEDVAERPGSGSVRARATRGKQRISEDNRVLRAVDEGGEGAWA